MGRVIQQLVAERTDCTIAAGVDLFADSTAAFPAYTNIADVQEEADVIIDFSHPSLLEPLLDYAVSHKIPAVVCTTGLSPEQVDKLKQAADKIPVFFSANMSLGVSLLCELAKKAAKVSPQAAVTGNINQTNNLPFNKAINTRMFHVDTAMGVHHAFSNKRSMVLITGSFAISIVMFLCFSVLISFMDHALSPLKPYAPDMAVESSDGVTLLPASLKQEITDLDGVDKAYGRMFYTDISASIKQSSNTATIMSYDEPQFEWANDLLV